MSPWSQPLWSHPEWLGAVVCTTAALGLTLALARWRALRRSRALLGSAAARATGAGDLALFLAFALLGAALLGPRLGERRLALPAHGVDVVFLVDVSRSMDVRDVPPSRLARARRAVAALLERLEARDRAGLAAFGERGVLLAPLTPDREALNELLDALDSDLVHPAGSNLGAGVEAALAAFASGEDRPRVIVALSDGEDPRARRDLGADAARRAGVRVLAAGLGTESGATVPDGGAALRDESGRVVRSRRRMQRLTRLAEATDGQVFKADAWGELELERILSAIRRDAGAAPAGTTLRSPRDVRVLPLAIASFVLLLGESWPRPRRRAAARVGGLTIAALLGLAATADEPPLPPQRPLEVLLHARPHDPRLLLHVGLARLEAGRPEAAARAFSAAAVYARDPKLAALAYHDLGVAQLERGELAAARDAFLDTLALAPHDRRARFNLEWTLAGLASTPPEAEPAASDAPPPEPEPPQRPRPEPHADPEPAPVPPSSPEQRRRLLERVTDDPVRALRSAADPKRLRRPAGPAW